MGVQKGFCNLDKHDGLDRRSGAVSPPVPDHRPVSTGEGFPYFLPASMLHTGITGFQACAERDPVAEPACLLTLGLPCLGLCARGGEDAQEEKQGDVSRALLCELGRFLCFVSDSRLLQDSGFGNRTGFHLLRTPSEQQPSLTRPDPVCQATARFQ